MTTITVADKLREHALAQGFKSVRQLDKAAAIGMGLPVAENVRYVDMVFAWVTENQRNIGASPHIFVGTLVNKDGNSSFPRPVVEALCSRDAVGDPTLVCVDRSNNVTTYGAARALEQHDEGPHWLVIPAEGQPRARPAKFSDQAVWQNGVERGWRTDNPTVNTIKRHMPTGCVAIINEQGQIAYVRKNDL